MGMTIYASNTNVHHRQSITVHYTGKLFSDGSVFDSSVTRGDPFTFNLGTRAVIQGWEQGVPGMCVGEKRKLIIPPEMGYGAQGSPPKIPANSHLVFEVELISINDATPRQMPPPHHQFGGQGMEFDEDGGEMYDAGTFDPQAHASQALRKMDAERKQQQQLEMEMPGHDDL